MDTVEDFRVLIAPGPARVSECAHENVVVCTCLKGVGESTCLGVWMRGVLKGKSKTASGICGVWTDWGRIDVGWRVNIGGWQLTDGRVAVGAKPTAVSSSLTAGGGSE